MSRHHSIFTLAAGWLLTFSPAHAAEPLACENSLGLHLAENAVVTTQSDDATIEFEAGEIEGSLGSNTTATLKDGVLLRRGDKLVGAETVRYDPQQRALLLDGDVRYEDPATEITSDAAEFAYDSGQIQFSGAEFSLGDNNARGGAANILISQAGILRLNDVRYTTCPPGSNDWELQGSEISINTREGVGTARNMRLRFQGVPIFWAPYISFPVGDARKSGILTPEIGSSGRSGNEIRVPYYWNIAPNYDATLTPRLLTSRGLQLQTEFRYLSKRNTGQVVVQYLNNDKLFDDTRQLLSVRHRTSFSNGWRGLLNFREVSDNQYFEDLGGSLSASSTTHLNRNLSFDWHTDTMSWLLKAQGFQTLDDAILPDQKPYRRLPQLAFSGYWPEHFAGLTTSLDAEVVNFDRDIGVTGWRANIAPRLELPIDGSGWFINPSLAWDYTQYDLDNVDPGFNDAPTRHVPISSLDTGLVFERLMNSSTQRIQTIEPRLLYVHIPFRQQDDLPVFDTIDPDLNLVQLFRTNRFLGVDRIGDTDQISVGVTSRILDVESGKELVTATVGQTRYLSDRRVTLPGGSPATLETSDYIAAVRFLLYENLNFDFGHQWGSGVNGTTQSEARLQYRPSTNKIVNIAYRYRRDSLEQGDLSWSWPLAKQWNFVGRYNYSFRDEAVLEQFFGLEYESCCWGLRLVSRRHISTRDGTRDSSFGLQLVLKGMTSVGTAADKLLERGILGYSADLR